MANSVGLVLLMAFPFAVLISAFRAMRRWDGGWRMAARLPIIAIVGDLVFSYASNLVDPGSHLWPYELATITAVSAVFLIGASSLRKASLKAGKS
ncbi:MAG: hypothetical protein WBQ26_10300 [Gemmatimonadaceae bacterium]|nr:hypothetical protein [Gemmatimonadaceae bacterium]